jgi:hypothetical protein
MTTVSRTIVMDDAITAAAAGDADGNGLSVPAGSGRGGQ